MAQSEVARIKERLQQPEVKWEEAGEGSGFFVAYQPDLPGCMAQGESPEEALSSLEEARDLYLTAVTEEGLPLPAALREAAERGARRGRAREGRESRTVRLPPDLWQRLDERARAHLRSTNAEAECAIRAWLSGEP